MSLIRPIKSVSAIYDLIYVNSAIFHILFPAGKIGVVPHLEIPIKIPVPKTMKDD